MLHCPARFLVRSFHLRGLPVKAFRRLASSRRSRNCNLGGSIRLRRYPSRYSSKRNTFLQSGLPSSLWSNFTGNYDKTYRRIRSVRTLQVNVKCTENRWTFNRPVPITENFPAQRHLFENSAITGWCLRRWYLTTLNDYRIFDFNKCTQNWHIQFSTHTWNTYIRGSSQSVCVWIDRNNTFLVLLQSGGASFDARYCFYYGPPYNITRIVSLAQ